MSASNLITILPLLFNSDQSERDSARSKYQDSEYEYLLRLSKIISTQDVKALLPFLTDDVLRDSWVGPSKESVVTYGDNDYSAVTVQCGRSVSIPGNNLVALTTDNDLIIFIEMNDTPRSGLELFKYAEKISQNARLGGHRKVTLPLATVGDQFELSLKGINTSKPTKLLGPVLGVRDDDAIIIDRPFNLWVTRMLIPFPLLAVYVGPDSWKI